MTTKPVLKMGNKQLASPSLPVQDFATKALLTLIQNMQDTMREKGGVGIAAPQIGVNERVIMFGFDHNSGFDEYGKPITRIVEGFHARILQHECDHLDGVLFPQRVRDLRFFGFEDEIDYLK